MLSVAARVPGLACAGKNGRLAGCRAGSVDGAAAAWRGGRRASGRTGAVALAGIGWLFLGQKLDLPALLGIGLIVAGVVVLHGFSQTVAR